MVKSFNTLLLVMIHLILDDHTYMYSSVLLFYILMCLKKEEYINVKNAITLIKLCTSTKKKSLRELALLFSWCPHWHFFFWHLFVNLWCRDNIWFYFVTYLCLHCSLSQRKWIVGYFHKSYFKFKRLVVTRKSDLKKLNALKKNSFDISI